MSTVKNNTAVAPIEENPFTAYAKAALTQNITGTLLKFSKGDWLAGKEGRQIAPGTSLVADMDSYSVGWVRWEGGKPTTTHMVRIIDRQRPPSRDDLGDHDEELWPSDDRGEPRDPWQFTNNLALANPKTGEVFTFSTASRGGRKALDTLCQEYGLNRHLHMDEWPVVRIDSDSYQHTNKNYGRIKEPTFEIVAWVKKDSKSVAEPPAAVGTDPRYFGDSRRDLDDEIPF